MNFSYIKCGGSNLPHCSHGTCCKHHCSICGQATHVHTHVQRHVHTYVQPTVQYQALSTKTIKPALNKPVTSNNFFKIVIVLDESGSMDSIKDIMRKSINDLITEQKQVEGRQATFTLVKFNDKVHRVVENIHLDDVRNIKTTEYNPQGPTALYDAIGDTINWFRNEQDVLMVIVTDGAENSSKVYKKHDISKMIKDKETKNNWTYVYLSCDLNTFDQGNNIGLNMSNNTSNLIMDQHRYGDFVSQNLNSAIKNYRKNGQSVQKQLNHQE